MDAVRAVGAAFDDGVQKNHVFAALQHIYPIRSQSIQRIRERGQLVIVRGKDRFGRPAGALSIVQLLQDGLGCVEEGIEYVIECEVYPVDQLTVQPKTAGPYVFDSSSEARRFIDESLLALQIFGCEIS